MKSEVFPDKIKYLVMQHSLLSLLVFVLVPYYLNLS